MNSKYMSTLFIFTGILLVAVLYLSNNITSCQMEISKIDRKIDGLQMKLNEELIKVDKLKKILEKERIALMESKKEEEILMAANIKYAEEMEKLKELPSNKESVNTKIEDKMNYAMSQSEERLLDMDL